jgi:hypothetical protein
MKSTTIKWVKHDKQEIYTIPWTVNLKERDYTRDLNINGSTILPRFIIVTIERVWIGEWIY